MSDPNEDHLDALSDGFRSAEDRRTYVRRRRERVMERRDMMPRQEQDSPFDTFSQTTGRTADSGATTKKEDNESQQSNSQ